MTEVLLADAGLEDLDLLLRDLRPGVRLIPVPRSDDAVSILADALASRPKILHVLAHGAPGEIRLGSAAITASSLLDRAWPDAGGCEIRLYACRVGEGEAGRRFLDRLTAATGARIAASDHLVGAPSLGGDWLLDVRAGDRGERSGASAPFSGTMAWNHVLAVFTGGPGTDTLTGGPGTDTLIGGAGDDMLNGGPGADFMDGGEGFDVVTYDTAATGVVVDLTTPANNRGEAAGDMLVNIERVIGSNFADTLVGGAGNDWFWGHDGDDVEYGNAGDDTLESGNGNDTIFGGNGNDHIYGRTDDDELHGGDGNDWIEGGSGNDLIHGDTGNDTLVGDWGIDTIRGGSGDDVILAGEIIDPAANFSEAQADLIFGEDGNDTYVVRNTLEAGTVGFDGGAGTDTLRIDTTGQTSHAIDISGMRLASVEILEFADNAAHTITMTAAQATGFTEIRGGGGVDQLVILASGNGATIDLGRALIQSIESVRITGTAGNDLITSGSAGNGTINGGGGFDAVRFAGRAADYTLTTNDDGSVTVAGAAGTTVLTNVEMVRFADSERLLASSITTGFDEGLYLRFNPDVAAAVRSGGLHSGLEHFRQFGQAEGRLGLVSVDEVFYRGRNPDVDAAIKAGALASGWQHFVQFGMAEGRSPNALFDTAYYLTRNADVAAAVQAGATTAYEHYMLHGWTEGRDPSALFSTSEYLRLNPDVAAAKLNPLAHFLDHGALEGRLALPAEAGLWG